MDRFLRFIGLLACIILIAYGVYWLMQHFPKYIGLTLQALGAVALVVLVVRLYLGRDWLVRIGQEFVIGSDLIQATKHLLNDLPKPENETTANFIGHLVYRFTRLGVIGLILALIPITLLYQQNQLLSSQNERIDNQNELITQQNELVTQQNKRLDQQTYLQEAERRSSLVFLFSNIMDAIDRELKDDYGNDDIRNLSPQLTGRIIALSERLTPYRYLEGDSLTTKAYSPERGQLLISLHLSDLDSFTMRTIFSQSNFSSANLRFANLKNAYLPNGNLSGANLEYSDMSNVDLSGTQLRKVNLISANLEGANLSFATLLDSDLESVYFKGVNLHSASTSGTNFKYAVVEKDFFKKLRQENEVINSMGVRSGSYITKNYQLDSSKYGFPNGIQFRKIVGDRVMNYGTDLRFFLMPKK